MRSALLLPLLLLAATLHGQQWNWAADACGGGNVDLCYGIATDSQGNAYWVGSASGEVDFGCGTLSTGNSDILGFVAKRAPDGSCVWVRGITTTLFEAWAYGIAIDGQDRIYVTGSFQGNANFGSGVALDGFSGDDIFLARFDTAGTCIWARRAGSSSDDEARSVTVSANHDVFITGTCNGTSFNFDGITVPNPANYKQVVVARYDSLGTVHWARASAGNGQSKTARAISVAGDRLFVTGQLGFTAATFNGLPITPGSQGTHLYVLATDLDGNAQWARSFGSGDHEGMGISADTLGNVFVAARMWGTLHLPDDTLVSVSSNDDMLVMKLDHDGGWQWARSTGSSQRDVAWDVAADGAGNAYFAQHFNQSIDYFGTPFTALGGEDILISKLDGDGEVVWAARPSGFQRDIPLCIHRRAIAPHEIYFGGYFWGAITYGNTTIDDVLNGDAMIVAGVDTTYHVSTFAEPVCAGSCVGVAHAFVTGEAPFSYNWSSGGGSAMEHGLCTGAYIVEVTDGNGQVRTDTVQVQERVDPGYIVQRTADSLWVEGGVSWQWYLNDDQAWSDSSSIVASGDGWYHAVVTDAFGCTWHSDTVQVVHVRVGEHAGSGSMRVYPNPVDHLLCVAYGGSERLTAVIRDSAGRRMKELLLPPGTSVHEVNDLASGMYILEGAGGLRVRIVVL